MHQKFQKGVSVKQLAKAIWSN